MTTKKIKREHFVTREGEADINLCSTEKSHGFIFGLLARTPELAVHIEYIQKHVEVSEEVYDSPWAVAETEADVREDLQYLKDNDLVSNRGDYWIVNKLYSDFDVTEANSQDMASAVDNAKIEIRHIAVRLDLPDKTITKADDIIEIGAKKNILSGKTPQGNAAGAVYVAGILTWNKYKQSEVADASGVSEVTVRNRYQDLVGAAGIY